MPVPLPVLAGPLRGCWWLPSSGGKVLRVLLGSYEAAQTRAFQRMAARGTTVFDVGAHVGYYTLLAARLVGPRGSVVAFEPDPRNHANLRRHVELNRLDHVQLVDAAVADYVGAGEFEAGTGTGTGHLAEQSAGVAANARSVRVTTVDRYVEASGAAPHIVKIDVEGSEAAVLRGARSTLARHAPALLLSTHGDAAHHECLALLAEIGYTAAPLDDVPLESAREVVCQPASVAR